MITQYNLCVHEFIGLECQVVESISLPYKNIKGKIIDETKNTFVLQDNKGQEKRVPKKGCCFCFLIAKDTKVYVNGNKIAYRPYDRPKKIRIF